MEKKIYEKPIMQVEAFVAANYCVEKCGDIERKYSFVCTSQSGIMYLYNNSPASGPKPSTSHSRTRIGRYSPCGFAHEAPTSGDFNWGFIDRNGNGREDSDEAAILYLEHQQEWNWWSGEYEDHISNGHATGKLDMDEWEINKS